MLVATVDVYGPLVASLVALPPETASVTLTLAEVEAIIGAPLPPSARTRAWWWHAAHARQPRAWHRVGWRVESVRSWSGGYRQWEVTFIRTAPDTIAPPHA
jgi:hypothetical protein